MAQPREGRRPLRDAGFFSFRGNWHLPFIIWRYFRAARSGFTPGRMLNALVALAEMRLGRTRVCSRPFVLRVEPTNLCNLRCPRCACGLHTDPRKRGVMALEDYASILDQNRRYGMVVRLDGMGEPTLHPRIFEMIRMAKSYKFSVAMSTNFNTESCACFESLVACGLDRLTVAIDGSTQESYERYRVGGSLSLVEGRLRRLLDTRQRRASKTPLVEVQFLDWGYNHEEIPDLERRVRKWGVDRFTAIAPDWAIGHGHADPCRPRRCFWLWAVLTVDWDLNYLACTNAWTYSWPRLNLRDVPLREFWNHELMGTARRYNIAKSDRVIASDPDCHCNNCSDMLVVDRSPGEVCR